MTANTCGCKLNTCLVCVQNERDEARTECQLVWADLHNANLQVEQLQNAVAEMLDLMMAGGTPDFFRAKTRVEALIEKRKGETC